MGDSLTERLRRLEDAARIRQLNLEYRRHLDARDLDAYGRLFAADGEWLGGTGYGQGPAGITAMLKERLAGNPGPPGPTSWHLVTESGVDVRGDWATGTVTWALIQRGDGDKPVMRLLGHYDDVYVREHGRWRYRRRIAYTDIPYRKLEVPADWAGGTVPGAGDAARHRLMTISRCAWPRWRTPIRSAGSPRSTAVSWTRGTSTATGGCSPRTGNGWAAPATARGRPGSRRC